VVLPRFQASLPQQKGWLLCGFTQTARPTGSSSGNTKASGQRLPLIRPLDDPFVCGPQPRLRSFPGNDRPGTRGDEMGLIERGGKIGGIQIPLDRTHAAGAVMPALGERLFHAPPTPMTELAQFGPARGNLDQGAARSCNGALEVLDKHPWCSQSHALAVLFLPRFVGNPFENDRVAHRHDLVDLSPMQALAVSRQFAFSAGFPAPRLLVAPAVFPPQTLLAVLLDPTLFIVVVGIGGPALPIHLALQPADVFLIGSQLLTQQLQACFGFSGHQGNGGGSQVCSDRLRPHRVFGFVVGHAFQRELHAVAIPLAVSPLRVGTAGLALHQAGVFDPLAQAVLHDGIVPVDEGWELIVLPNEEALLAFFRLLEHKAQTGIVALILEACEAASSAFEAHAAGLAQADPLESVIGSGCQGLSEHRIQVVGQPVHPQGFACLVQRVLRKAVLLAHTPESDCAVLFARARNSPGRLPGRIGPHRSQPFQTYGEHGIVELPACFQVAPDMFGLALVHHEGQFQQKGWRPTMVFLGSLCGAHGFSSLRCHLPALSGRENVCSNNTKPRRVCQAIHWLQAVQRLPSPHTRNVASSPG